MTRQPVEFARPLNETEKEFMALLAAEAVARGNGVSEEAAAHILDELGGRGDVTLTADPNPCLGDRLRQLARSRRPRVGRIRCDVGRRR